MGWLSDEEMKQALVSSRAVIYPSLYESFGLGLVEAAAMNVPVYASQKDYVMDVIKPSGTFDPHSIVEIRKTIEFCFTKDYNQSVELRINNGLDSLENIINETNTSKPK